MKRKKIDSSLERQFLIGLITSTPFLAGASSLLDAQLFPSEYVKQVAQWCLDFHRKYKHAPGKAIEPLYHVWVDRDKPNDDDAEAVSDFLGSISEQYDNGEQINAPHLLDELAGYLIDRRAAKLKDAIDHGLLYGDRETMLNEIQSFRGSARIEPAGFNLLERGPLQRAFADPLESLIDWPDDAQWFFGGAITRDALIGVQGPEKRGKTYWCIEFLYRAVRSRRRVAMFQVGDLSEAQLVKRLAVRVSGLPLWQSQCEGVNVPRKIELVQVQNGYEAQVTHKVVKFPHPVDYASARRAQKEFNRRHKIDQSRPTMKFSVHPMGSINVRGIDAILQRWRHEDGFVPDVILIDYADILAPENPRSEPRNQINETWMAMRRLSQEWHACVVAPTQANAASYDATTQKMKNFSNDKRKLSHVTGMLGLNQTEKEKLQGIMRLNWLVLRESEFHANSCLWVAQCIPLGVALAKSTRVK